MPRKTIHKRKRNPGVFFDSVTGKLYDLSASYECGMYDTVPIYRTFSEQVRAWGISKAVSVRISGWWRDLRYHARVRRLLATARYAVRFWRDWDDGDDA